MAKKHAAPPPAAAPPLSEYPALFEAAGSFVRTNSQFESSVAIEAVVREVGLCTDAQAAFATPLSHKLFSMDAALRWALFLAVAPERAAQEGDALAGEAALPWRLQLAEAFGLVAAVYDLSVQDAVWTHFEDDDEDDDEEEDDEEEDDEPEEATPAVRGGKAKSKQVKPTARPKVKPASKSQVKPSKKGSVSSRIKSKGKR